MEKWQDPKIIALWIAIILVFFSVLVFFIVKIVHAGYKRMIESNRREAQMQLDHQKKLMETSLLAQERERKRIAADLHDGLIGKLSVIRMKTQIGAEAQDIESMLEESIGEARRISHDLTPPLLEFSEPGDLIDNLLQPWKEKFTIRFREDVRSEGQLSVNHKIQLVRIMQELLTNIIKHAGAATIEVHLRQTGKYIALTVKDDGNGFDTETLKKGLGLDSLELRAQYLNAHYRVKSAIGKGTVSVLAGTP